MRNRRLLVIPVFLLVVGLVCSGASFGIGKGDKAPDFQVKTLDGKDLSLRKLLAPGVDRKKAVILSFWATWCPPCRQEAPHLNKLYNKYKDKSVAVVAISIDQEGAKAVRPLVDKMGLKYTIGLDPEGKAAEKYGVQYIPLVFVIDSRGVIRLMRQGYSADTEKSLEAAVKAALDTK